MKESPASNPSDQDSLPGLELPSTRRTRSRKTVASSQTTSNPEAAEANTPPANWDTSSPLADLPEKPVRKSRKKIAQAPEAETSPAEIAPAQKTARSRRTATVREADPSQEAPETSSSEQSEISEPSEKPTKRPRKAKASSAPSRSAESAPTPESNPPGETPYQASQAAYSATEDYLSGSPSLSASTLVPEPSRKNYPVYVPLHLAKQLEQKGKSAPLAVPAEAPEAAEVRAFAQSAPPAAVEWQPGSPSVNPSAAPVTSSAAAPEKAEPAQRTEPAHSSGPGMRPETRHTDFRAERPGHERQHERQDRHDRHDRRRGRHDRRRGGGRHEPEGERHAAEAPVELPPPTPEELFLGEGIIEISGKGFGFLRDARRGFIQSPTDIFVSPEMVRKFNLRDGQWIKGQARRGGRGQQMHEIYSVNDLDPLQSRLQPAFEELTVINPQEPLRMETRTERYTTRIIDLVSPIGKGQRGLIVAPPRTGKTTLLQHIADGMVQNHPDVKLIMLLVDERPEEVTEIKHTVPTAEIMASSNDMDVRSHTRIAELAIERAKRLVEAGRDVFILLDSITRLGRAFNNAMTGGGRTMSGGVDARALEIPRKLFAAARNTEEAGSLTIVATALIETGSRMDELIFQEFKGTGNMELVLDRKIAEQRIYPAVDIFQSGTRREELLVPADALQKIHFIRRGLAGCRPLDAIERLLFYLKKFPTNEQMLREIRG